MECPEIKKNLPFFLDDVLRDEQRTDIQVHLSSCDACQKELQAYRRSWDLLKEFSAIEPDPDYVSRFWTNLVSCTPWHYKLRHVFRYVFSPRVASVWVTACLLLIATIFVTRNYWQIEETETLLTSLPIEEVELIDNLELVENYEVIQNMDVLEDWEVLDSWENKESQG